MPAKHKGTLSIVIATIFLDLLGFGILIPVVPLLFVEPTSRFFILHGHSTPKMGFIFLGFLIASFTLGQFVANPILGELSDRFGRKPIMICSLIGTAIGYLMFGSAILMKNVWLLFVSRVFDGITGGNISVAQAAIADITEPQYRSRNFGLVGAAFGLGFILGPYLGGKLSDPSINPLFNPATPFWVAACLAFINVIFFLVFFEETYVVRKIGQINWFKSWHNIRHALESPLLSHLYVTVFLFQGGFAFFTTFFSVFLIQRFHFNQSHIGNLFAYIGLWVVITQAFINPLINRLDREKLVLFLSLIGCGVATWFYFVPSSSYGLYLVVPFFSLFNGLVQANLLALISRTAANDIQGEVLGISSSVQALAQSIPPILSGFIAASLTSRAPVFISGLMMIVAAIWFWAIKNRIQGKLVEGESSMV